MTKITHYMIFTMEGNMIKHLSGDFETVDYVKNNFILYDNTENEDYPVHWHNAVEIIMPLQNGFTVCTSNTVYELGERDLILIPAGDLHSLKSPEKGRRLIFQCDSSVIANVSALNSIMPLFSEAYFINSESSEELRIFAKKAMLDIYNEYYTKSELTEVNIYIKFISLLAVMRENQIKLFESKLDCTTGKLIEYNEKFNLVFKFIDKNYMEDITIEKLADIAGYSKYHFSRIFKQYSSISYIKYVNIKRTKVAEKLLLDPRIPITDVAMRSGFSSLATFNRIFKEIKHCTPSDFKKLYRNARPAEQKDDIFLMPAE